MLVNAISLKQFPCFKLKICFHIIQWTDAIYFGPSAKTKMAAMELLKYML